MTQKKIVITCDTTIAYCKDEMIQQNLHVIPLNAIVNGVEYHDSVDIDTQKLCQMMRDGAKVSTSTPTPIEIENFFNDVFAKTQADVIIHFTISSKLSSMYSLFTTICQEKFKDKVRVVDSVSLCQWMANQVIYAQRLADAHYDVDEIIKRVNNDLIHTEECVFIPESIEYLKRGGRISPALATIVNFIGILPVLSFKDGEVGKKGTTRTMGKAMINALKEWKENIVDLKQNYDLIIVYADQFTPQQKQKIEDIIADYMPNMKCIIKRLSLNVTAHAGPGTLGLGIIKKIPEVKEYEMDC